MEAQCIYADGIHTSGRDNKVQGVIKKYGDQIFIGATADATFI